MYLTVLGMTGIRIRQDMYRSDHNLVYSGAPCYPRVPRLLLRGTLEYAWQELTRFYQAASRLDPGAGGPV